MTQMVVIISKVKLLRALKEMSLNLEAVVLAACLPQSSVVKVFPHHLGRRERDTERERYTNPESVTLEARNILQI